MIKTLIQVLAVIVIFNGITMATGSDGSGCANPTLKLGRGICIDRQLRAIPPELKKTITRDDIQLIKSMGFEFVKLIFNPTVLKSEGGLDSSHLWYFDRVVQLVVDEKLPVVVCIHPEADFKRSVLGNADEFSRFVGFMDALSRHMASRWTADQLAFQLMTEPFGSSSKPEDWNYWDRLQQRLWKTIRSGMPRHTLILSGDMVGAIDGLFNITPVNDENVLYGFSFYDPQVFTQQGTGKNTGDMFHLKNLLFPSGPHTLTAMPTILASVPDPWKADIARRIEHYAAEQWDDKKLAARIGKLAEWRKLHGNKVKLWCVEFGCYEAAPPADRRHYINQVRTLFEELGIGWCYWSYNEAFSVMAAGRTRNGPANEQTPDKTLLKMLLPDKYPDK